MQSNTRRHLDPGVTQEITRRVVRAVSPERIILFGSAARDEMGPDSDVDLLVIKAGDYRKHALAVAIRVALRGLPEAFDIIVATPEEIERYKDSFALVYRHALREGRVIYAA
jgi:predicted nucleotidyltransferase